jgi:phosphohistidine phosphatase
MGKLLILIRHAKSDWSDVGQKDIDRELNRRGHSDAPRMGRKLAEMNLKPDLIVSSPSRRTTLTTQYICEQLSYPLENVDFQEDIYEASVRTLLRLVNELDNSLQTVFIVGHNPGFTYFSENLTGKEIGNIPTCGIVELAFELEDWALVSQNTATLKSFIYPKMFLGGTEELIDDAS